jgi:C1A family cysteine protease
LETGYTLYDAYWSLYDDYQELESNNKEYEAGTSNFELQLYPFSYLKPADFAKDFFGAEPYVEENQTLGKGVDPNFFVPKVSAASVVAVPPECKNIPASKNWATESKMSPVQSQGECNSCYMFSANAVLEGTASIIYNAPPVKLSNQHTLECVKTITGKPKDGCNTGR